MFTSDYSSGTHTALSTLILIIPSQGQRTPSYFLIVCIQALGYIKKTIFAEFHFSFLGIFFNILKQLKRFYNEYKKL